MSDQLYFTTSVLIPFNGTNGSTTFTNYAPAGAPILDGTGNAQISTAQSKFGGSSLLLDGVGDFLTVTPLSSMSASGDFTLEGWFYAVAFPAAGVNAYLISYYSSMGLCFRGNTAVWLDSSTPQITSAALTANTWYHLAAVRLSDVITLYVDGVAVATTRTYAPVVTVAHIGGYTTNTLNGYIDDVRVTRYAARYSTNFTPPGAHDLESPPIVPGIQAALIPLVQPGRPPLTPSRLEVGGILRDMNHNGTGRIVGTVKETGTPNTPVFKRVRLHRQVDGLLVREQWSDPVTGTYAFNNIDPAYKFYVVSHDHVLNYNAVIKDNLTPEPMP